ncbi:MAG: DUF2235 domain-containing protein [Parvibaculum sp.]|nr:DUF2235 domain-containing protein [Parvibaculum sp.]
MATKKRLAVFLDGTWNEPETADGKHHSTNILKMMRALRRVGDDGVPQVVYYLKGVGTNGRKVRRLSDGATGAGLDANIHMAYQWVANNFEPGADDLYIFGFSRGAYTARSLAGLIGAVGLMTKREVGELPQAFDYYRCKPELRKGHPYHQKRDPAVRHFPAIRCVGVFDTVGALGIPETALIAKLRRRARDLGLPVGKRPEEFHDVMLGTAIENAFHAMAVDERRKFFEPTIWEKPVQWGGRLVQRWFAGSHSNVGGGYPETGLSDVTLKWMIDRASECGLLFDPVSVGEFIGASSMHKGVLVDSSQEGIWGAISRLAPGTRRHRAVREDIAHEMKIDRSVFLRHVELRSLYEPFHVADFAMLFKEYLDGPDVSD